MTEEQKIRTKEYLWLLIIVILASLPLFLPGIEGRTGQDLQFHLNRIEGIATEIRAGHWGNRMSAYWLDGYGYPVSVYYGDLLLYLPALLRIIGVPVTAAYKAFVILINGATVLAAYFCFSRIFQAKRTAFLCTAAYSLSAYRFLDLYIRAAVGEYCAMIFLPFLALSMWQLYGSSDREKTEQPGRTDPALPLIIGMSGLIATHLITTEMAVITMGLMALVMARKTFRWDRLRVWLKAVGWTLLLNLYFLVPFLDYYFSEEVAIQTRMAKDQLIQEDGAYLWQFFAFLQNPFGTIISNHGDIMAFHPGILLMGALAAAVILCVWGFVSRRRNDLPVMRFLTIASLALIWISSSLFPWNAVEKLPLVGKILIQVQFPWRYVSILCVTLTLLLGFLLERFCPMASGETGAAGKRGREKTTRTVTAAIAAAILFTVGFFTAEYALHYQPVFYQTAEDLDATDVGYFEYLRSGTKKKELTGQPVYGGDGSIAITDRNGTDMTLRVTSNPDLTELDEDDPILKETVTVTLPVINYKGYRVSDDFGVLYDISDGDQNQIQINLPVYYTGRLYVTFQQPLLWTLALWTSVIALICLIWQSLDRRRAIKMP